MCSIENLILMLVLWSAIASRIILAEKVYGIREELYELYVHWKHNKRKKRKG